MPSGKGVQRTREQKLADHLFIGEMLVKGHGSSRILEKLNTVRHYRLKLRTIQKDIADIREAWGSGSRESFAFYAQRELRLIDLVQAEAFDAWDKSKEQKKRQESETSNAQDGRPQTRAKVIIESACGNPDFLLVILKCAERRAKLLGLDKQRSIPQETSTQTFGEAPAVEIRILDRDKVPFLPR